VLFTLIALGAIAGGVWYVTREGSVLSPGPLALEHAQWDNEPGCYECHTEAADFRGLSDELCLACHQTLETRIAAKSGYHAQVEDGCVDCHADHQGTGEDEQIAILRWPEPEAPFKPTVLGSREQEEQKRQSFPHDTTGFELNDAHAKIDCETCHAINLILDSAVIDFGRKPGAAEGSSEPSDYFGSYLGLQAVCGDCHHDPPVPTMGAACDDCHDEKAWAPSTNFVHEPPNTRYPLEGKHADVACDECHITQPDLETPPPPPGLPTFEHVLAEKQPPVFRGVGFGRSPARPVEGETLPDCENCHGNVHRVSSETFWDCKSCHDERGWKPWIESGFDHDTTGFKLEKGHAGVACDKCHGEKEGDQGPLQLPKLEACDDCHEDVHKGAFDREMALARGKSCELCHDIVDWKKSTYRESEHPEQVPLIDTHASIRCEDCHGKTLEASCQLTRGGKPDCVTGPPFPRLPARGQVRIGRLEQECQSCHRDIHDGRLTAPQRPGKSCRDCHDFKGWKDAPFDEAEHARIGFEVRGAHKRIFNDCGKCHGGRSREGGLKQVKIPNANQDCNACHRKDDVHKGQLGNDCTGCHTEETWAPSTFTIAQHQQTDFPLNGAHMAVPCEVCHETDPRTKAQKWAWRDTSCKACHKTPHGRQFRKQACTECHTESAWEPSTYDVSRHNQTRFKLEGPHDTTCSKCHQPDPGGKVDRYMGTARACGRCHEDVHAGQFDKRYRDCSACHVVASWTPSFFDHDTARYKLDGAHRGVACDRCHQVTERKLPSGATRPVAHYYPIPGRKCDDCHQNPHQVGGGGE
jgi:hypothetical protein